MITLSTASLYPYGLNRIFAIAREAGFGGVELMLRSEGDTSYLDSWDADYLSGLEKEHGIKIVSLHVPFVFEKDQSSFDAIIRLAEKLKTDHIIIHAPRADQKDYAAWLQNILVENRSLITERGVIVENVHKKPGIADPIFDQAEDFCNFPGVCLDTAHALRSGLDPLVFLKKLDNIKQFHFSAWDGRDDHLSVLADKEKFAAILAFKPVKHICLELCPKAFNNIADQQEVVGVLRATIDFIKENKA